jgi:hypothetical protein
MLGSLFILTVSVVIVVFVITTVGDDIAHIWQSINGHLDPDLRHFRNLYKQTHR